MKKTLLILITLFSFSSVCFAYRATPFSTGIIANTNGEIIATNLDSPAYNEGIRPGDKLISTKINNQEVSIHTTLFGEKEKIDITYISNGQTKSVIITPQKIINSSQISSFIIKGDSNEIYQNLIKAITFDKDISSILTIVGRDNELKTITTYSTVNKKNVKQIPDYIVSTGGSGFGFEQLETKGSLALTNIPDTNFCLLKLSLEFRASWSHLFGKSWNNFSSSGQLEREIVKKIYNPNII